MQQSTLAARNEERRRDARRERSRRIVRRFVLRMKHVTDWSQDEAARQQQLNRDRS